MIRFGKYLFYGGCQFIYLYSKIVRIRVFVFCFLVIYIYIWLSYICGVYVFVYNILIEDCAWYYFTNCWIVIHDYLFDWMLSFVYNWNVKFRCNCMHVVTLPLHYGSWNFHISMKTPRSYIGIPWTLKYCMTGVYFHYNVHWNFWGILTNHYIYNGIVNYIFKLIDISKVNDDIQPSL